MKKALSLLVVLSLVCTMFTGCMYTTFDVRINDDGSGVANMFVGVEEEFIRAAAEADGLSFEEEISELVKYEYNGYTYYGNYESRQFKDVKDLNSALDDVNSVLTAKCRFERSEDGNFKIAVGLKKYTGNPDYVKKTFFVPDGRYEIPIDDEKLVKSYVIVYDFEFPENIVKTSGIDSEGIVIEGNKLHIDIMKVAEDLDYSVQVFNFQTIQDGEMIEDKTLKFSDVSKEHWFYNSVMTLANGGLVQGKGNGRFDPEGTITYAEFCTMLARANGKGKYKDNGYWASGEIDYCVGRGFVNDLGEIVAENYDLPITREAAVAAMYRANVVGDFVGDESGPAVMETDIPDFELISEEYQEDIWCAYNYEITKGIDDSKTFNPKGFLTRAEVCQLFYNIGYVIGY